MGRVALGWILCFYVILLKKKWDQIGWVKCKLANRLLGEQPKNLQGSRRSVTSVIGPICTCDDFGFFSLKTTVKTSTTTFDKNEKKIGWTGQTSKEPFSPLAAGKNSPVHSMALLTLDKNIVLIKHCFDFWEKQNVHFAARALLYSYFTIAYLCHG